MDKIRYDLIAIYNMLDRNFDKTVKTAAAVYGFDKSYITEALNKIIMEQNNGQNKDSH